MKRSKNFCFTINNPDPFAVESLKNIKFNFVIVGLETGDSGTPHLQGFLQTSHKMRARTVLKMFREQGFKPHLEIAKGTVDQNIKYCSKDGDVESWGELTTQGQRSDILNCIHLIDKGYSELEIMKTVPVVHFKFFKHIKHLMDIKKSDDTKKILNEKFKDVQLKVWQKKCLRQLESQTDRKILWVYDPIGNRGKTFLSLYLYSTQNACLLTNAKSQDIAYHYNYESIVVFDYTRSMCDFVNYSILESFKNGILFSPKYTSCTKIFPSCKVIVFSNFLPDSSKLSEDRLEIISL